MPPGKCGSYVSIKFTVRKIISGKDAVTVDVLHADNEFHIFLNQMSKHIETFIPTVCHQNSRYRIGVVL